MHVAEVQLRLLPLMKGVLRRKADLDPACLETSLFALGLDSLLILDLVMEIEREFGVRLDFKTFCETRNVVELSAAIASRLASGNEASGV